MSLDQAPFLVQSLMPPRQSLRVALVTETYPPEVNGVAMTVARLVDGLHQRGHAVQLIRPRQQAHEAASDEAPVQELLMRGLPIPRYPHLKLGLPAKRALIRQWQQHRPDVVHVATEGPLGWSALQAAHTLKLPVTSDFRTNFHAYSKHYGVGWLSKPIMAYLRKFHNRTQATMVPTAGLAQDLGSMGFKGLHVVGRGVDTERFCPQRRSDSLRREWGAGPQTQVVMCVGRLAPEKNLDLLMQAFEAVRSEAPDSKLVLVGDGPLRSALQQAHPQVHFAGMQTGTALAEHYASADLFLFPSVTETFGNVTLEAMASGLPVLAYRYAAAAQVIEHGVNGCLVDFDQAVHFIAQARLLAARRGRLQDMAAAARQTALTQGWAHIVSQVEAIMLQTCAQASR